MQIAQNVCCALSVVLAFLKIFFIFGTNTTHKGEMCCVPFPGPVSRPHWPLEVLLYPRRGPYLLDDYASYLAQIETRRFAAHHFKIAKSKEQDYKD